MTICFHTLTQFKPHRKIRMITGALQGQNYSDTSTTFYLTKYLHKTKILTFAFINLFFLTHRGAYELIESTNSLLLNY